MSNNPSNEQELHEPRNPEEALADPRLHWYVAHTYSGYENKVLDTLKKSVENSERMKNLILDIRIPVQEVEEIRKGKRVKTSRKVYPSYVMVKMIWTTESWYLVRNTRGVTGFVGPESKPVPLSDEEAERMLNPIAENKSDIAIGQEVEVVKGQFSGVKVVVQDIDLARGKVTVVVKLLGRENSVEMDIDDVEPVE
jgi:transcriptional antiterminator NusG